MKNKTNISVKDIRGVRITPYMELGENHGYVSGDLLDANATMALVEKKISEVVGGASSSSDTLKEIETTMNGKQDSIADLQTIREGAAAGATAIQEHQDISGKANTADLATVATSGSYLDLTNIPVAQMYYTFISYNPQDETEEWGRGIVKTTGGEVRGNIEVEVLSNTEEEFVGKKFYITSDAEPGDDTLYPLYTIDGTAVGISVKIIEQLQ